MQNRLSSYEGNQSAYVGQHLSHIEQTAESIGDQEKIEAIHFFREGLSRAGLSASSTKLLKHTRDGNKVVQGQFDTRTKQISMANLESLEQGAYQSGLTLDKYVEKVAKHELRHAEQAKNGNEKTYTMIAMIIKKDRSLIKHALLEADASHGTTDQFDAYDEERKLAKSVASQLKISVTQLHQIHRNGDSKKVQTLAESL